MSVSVDAKIVEARQAIERVHQTIYGLTRGIQNITNLVDTKLDTFSGQVHEIQNNVQTIRSGVLHVTNKFPNNTIYLLIFLAIDLIIWCGAMFLLHRIIKGCRYGGVNSDKVIEDYKHIVNPDYIQKYKREVDAEKVPVEITENEEGHTIPVDIPLIPPRASYRYWQKNEFDSALDPLLPLGGIRDL